MTVPELCVLTHNFFDCYDEPFVGGFIIGTDYIWNTFNFEEDVVANQTNILDGLAPHQYYKIEGSIFNDGVHEAVESLTPEKFYGKVQPMRVPKVFVELAKKITAYDEKLPSGGVYVSQSFNGWSGTMATGTDGLPADGCTRYRREINQWRKL